MAIKKRGQPISAAEVRELLASHRSTPAPDIADLVAGQAMLLDDGRFLVVNSDGRGVVYPSRAALDELLRQVEAAAAAGPVDLKRILLPPVDEVISHAPELAARLPSVLGLVVGTEVP